MSQDITIKLTDRLGQTHKLNSPSDIQLNLMELCKSYEFPVEGTCGGIALCATCQIYVTSDHKLNKRTEDEEAMLSDAFNVQYNSRLSCQINITPEIDGLSITLAPE